MKLSKIAKIMYDLQEYCRYISEINHKEGCNGCAFLYDHVKCRLVSLTKDNKIPCDNWGITPADIERLKHNEKERGYRFWVCKQGNIQLNEYIPVTKPFFTLNEANTWLLEHAMLTNETLYSIKASKDMWEESDIERLERDGK